MSVVLYNPSPYLSGHTCHKKMNIISGNITKIVFQVFVEDPKNPPDVWAHHLLVSENEAYFTYAVKARYQRAMRQFGVFSQNSSNTVAFGTEDDEYGTVYPNRLVYQEEENVTIAGMS